MQTGWHAGRGRVVAVVLLLGQGRCCGLFLGFLVSLVAPEEDGGGDYSEDHDDGDNNAGDGATGKRTAGLCSFVLAVGVDTRRIDGDYVGLHVLLGEQRLRDGEIVTVVVGDDISVLEEGAAKDILGGVGSALEGKVEGRGGCDGGSELEIKGGVGEDNVDSVTAGERATEGEGNGGVELLEVLVLLVG